MLIYFLIIISRSNLATSLLIRNTRPILALTVVLAMTVLDKQREISHPTPKETRKVLSA